MTGGSAMNMPVDDELNRRCGCVPLNDLSHTVWALEAHGIEDRIADGQSGVVNDQDGGPPRLRERL
jgi:hypothetical protein